MGSVRFDASPETAAQIERAARTDAFDPNLFTNRDDAVARLDRMPTKRTQKVLHAPNYTTAEFTRRLRFDPDAQVLNFDFSGFIFHHSRDVNDFYDHIEERIKASGQDKWFFLIDNTDCQIMPGAWVQYAFRGKRLNLRYSLGSVRYAPGSETAAEIRRRSESQDFSPNIRNTRAEALARIEEMRRETTS
ncbi:hypothetical protein SAMN04488093_101433 [Tropicibacter naphthalenivorans]|uniref:Uncharacterized protein n=2 Tax=Tropicibacter naphthalenivorans TaxID=441103 RepID=A0A0P1G162_9RHOB|nr:hypothetical protein TRN7648_00446 [Tropicibacter naphthalenivorans]SMC44417.1 hypothetical protein SAMN04488093_101433 [Tropicibacter naphthalenivorans]